MNLNKSGILNEIQKENYKGKDKTLAIIDSVAYDVAENAIPYLNQLSMGDTVEFEYSHKDPSWRPFLIKIKNAEINTENKMEFKNTKFYEDNKKEFYQMKELIEQKKFELETNKQPLIMKQSSYSSAAQFLQYIPNSTFDDLKNIAHAIYEDVSGKRWE